MCSVAAMSGGVGEAESFCMVDDAAKPKILLVCGFVGVSSFYATVSATASSIRRLTDCLMPLLNMMYQCTASSNS